MYNKNVEHKKERVLTKKAFTIVELIVCMLIIGVLSVIMLNVSTKKSANQYAKLYNTAYDTLVQAVGNAYLDWTPEKNIPQNKTALDYCGLIATQEYFWSKSCWEIYTATVPSSPNITKCPKMGKNSICFNYNKKYYILKNDKGATDESYYYSGILGFPRKYPSYLMGKRHNSGDYIGGRYDGWGTDEAFCKDLVQYINTIDSKNDCKSFITGFNNSKLDLKKGHGFHKIFCAATPPQNGQAVNRDDNCNESAKNSILPSFIAANGQKFYISGLTSANFPIMANGSDEALRERRYYRFVAVDLNGDSGPNRQYAKGAKFPWTLEAGATAVEDSGSYPDIVLFALTDNGQVIPLGLPEFTTVYATAKVYFPEFLDKVNADGTFVRNSLTVSDTMDLYSAKLMAWSDNGANAPNLLFGQSVDEHNPLSLAEMFYWVALNCGTKGCGDPNGKNNAKPKGIMEYGIGREGTSDSAKIPLYADRLMSNLVRQFIFKEQGKEIEKRSDTYIPTQIQNKLDTIHGCSPSTTKCKVQIEYQK